MRAFSAPKRYSSGREMPLISRMAHTLPASREMCIRDRDINNLPAGRTRIDGDKAVVTVSTVTPQMCIRDSDKTVLKRINEMKLDNKKNFAAYLEKSTGQVIDPNSIFDCQVKRMHEYKRQHLNALNIAAQYLYLKENPNADFIPKTYIFGAKAAPGYYMAKQDVYKRQGLHSPALRGCRATAGQSARRAPHQRAA